MTRRKSYLETDVLTEATRRVNHLFDVFDTVVVCFSGGKDSLAVLQLVREVAFQRGQLPVHVLFRDEEVIPDSVINFVDEYRQLPWIDMKWLCVPLLSHKFILGKRIRYRAWEPGRPWVRPLPSWGLRDVGQGNDSDQHTLDELLAARFWKGKVAFVTGIRAAESLIRRVSCMVKLNENWINSAKTGKRSATAKPVYDWEENDVFKFFMERSIRYCPLYDAQHLAGEELRVSTPLHAEKAKRIGTWRQIDADFYQRVFRVFPEMDVQERYWSEFDAKKMVATYAELGWDGVLQYIEDQIDPDIQKVALEMYGKYRQHAAVRPEVWTVAGCLAAMSSGKINDHPYPNYSERKKKRGGNGK